jgi:hypothetical protein
MKIYHTPGWYLTKVKDEYVGGRIKNMLKMDCGDNWDSHATDEENIQNYMELYESSDFIMDNGAEIAELEIKDMKELDYQNYIRMTNGYGDTEKEYLQVVDKIAQDLMCGSSNELNKMISRIRNEAQKPLKVKERERQKLLYKNVSGKGGIDQDERIFSWNNLLGSQKDYTKELNYTMAITNLMLSVEKRMDMIAKENIKIIKKQRMNMFARHKLVEKIAINRFDEGWFSRWLLLPLGEMINFNKIFSNRIKELDSETAESENAENVVKEIDKKINPSPSAFDRFNDFE